MSRSQRAARASVFRCIAGLLALTDIHPARAEPDQVPRYIGSQAYLHALAAELALAKGDEARALEELQLALVYDPESYHLTLELARLTWKIRGASRVERLVERAIRLSPRRAGAWLLRGQIARQDGRLAAARQAFERAAELEPRTALGGRAALAWAEVLEELGLRDRAIDVLSRFGKSGDVAVSHALVSRQTARGDLDAAIAVLDGLTHESSALLLTKAHLLDRAARRADAVVAWRELVALDPQDPARLTHAIRAEALAGEGARARALAVKLVERSPDRALDAARALWGGDLADDAIATLERRVAAARDDWAARLELARLELFARRPDRARALLADWPEGRPDYSAAVEVELWALVEAGKAAAAVRRGRAALAVRRDLGLVEAWATITSRFEDRAKVLQELSGAEQAAADPMPFRVLAAMIQAEGGDLEGAEARLSVSGTLPPHSRAALLFAQAQLEVRFGSVIRAERAARASLDAEPEGPGPLALLARLRAARRSRLAETDALLIERLAAQPDEAQMVAARGRLLVAQGKRELGTRWLLRAVELNPLDALSWEQLGDSELGVGHDSRARAAYDRAQALITRRIVRGEPDASALLQRLEKKRGRISR